MKPPLFDQICKTSHSIRYGLWGLIFVVGLNGGTSFAQDHATERMFAPPGFSKDLALTRARTRLKQKGYINQDHIDLDAYYQVDRRHHGQLVAIDRLVSAGKKIEAYHRLKNLMTYFYPHNRRAWLDMSKQATRLATQISGFAKAEYETALIEQFMVRAEICAIEVDGYKAPELAPRKQREAKRAAFCLKDICKRLTSVNVTCPETPAKIATGTNWGRPYSFTAKGIQGASLKHPSVHSRQIESADYHRVISTSDIYSYHSPSVYAQKRKAFVKGQRVHISATYIDSGGTKWSKVCDGACGWVASQFLTPGHQVVSTRNITKTACQQRCLASEEPVCLMAYYYITQNKNVRCEITSDSEPKLEIIGLYFMFSKPHNKWITETDIKKFWPHLNNVMAKAKQTRHAAKLAKKRKRQHIQCSSYARNSAQQHKTNLSNRCNRSGWGWSENEKTHYDWCMSLPEEVARLKTQHLYLERYEALQQCQ